jgi:hypothetical protein
MLVPAALVSVVLLIVLFAINIVVTGWLWRLASLPFVLVVLGVFLLTIQAGFSPYTAGANDNASGVEVALNVAQRLKKEPLSHTLVWVVLSGCEEVGCYGADAFAHAHRDELGSAVWIALDSVGGIGAALGYLTRETFLLTSNSDPDLVALADSIAARYPELNAYSHAFKGAYTEGAIGRKHGFRVLTLISHRRDGVLPEWHRPTDIAKNVDSAVVELTEAFTLKLLQGVDQQAKSKT